MKDVLILSQQSLRQSIDSQVIKDKLDMKWCNGTAIGGCSYILLVKEWIIQYNVMQNAWMPS